MKTRLRSGCHVSLGYNRRCNNAECAEAIACLEVLKIVAMHIDKSIELESNF